MTSTQTSECRVCASRRFEPTPPDARMLSRCLECGFVWRSATLERSVSSIYDDTYFTEDGHYPAYFARADQWRFEAQRRLEWLHTASPPRRLLEIGCGGGFFLEAAESVGIEAYGVDLVPAAVEYAREKLGVRVTHGAFEEVDLPGSFDAVCAFHVLEHVSDPEAFLEKVHSLLRPYGWLALEVPNIDSARARRERTEWGGLVLDQHLWHFSPQTLPTFLGRSGFAAHRVDTAFPRHYFRPLRRLSRPGLANLFHDWRAARTLASAHPTAGDFLRVLAQRVPAESLALHELRHLLEERR